MPSLLAVHVDRLVVDDRLVLVQEADERVDAALVQELVALPVRRARRRCVIVTPPLRNASSRSRWASVSKLKSTVSKICGSGLKVTLVPRFLVVPVTSRLVDRRAALVGSACRPAPLRQISSVERLRQRVDDRDADAVQTAGNLVAVVVEFAAGVQHRQHDFGRRLAAGVLIDRDAAAVVDDRHRAVDVERDVDLVAEPASASSIELSTTS